MFSKRLFTLILASATIVLLAGCTGGTTSTGQNTEQQTALSTTQPPQKEYSLADQTAYSSAIQLKDTTFCDKISNADYRQQCKTSLADKAALQDAVTKMDASLCGKLSTHDKQNSCKIQVEVLLKQRQTQEAFQNQIKSDQKLSSEIYASGNYQRCSELSMETSRIDCESNILSNKAIQAKDPSWCDKVNLESAKQECQSNYAEFSSGGSAPQP